MKKLLLSLSLAAILPTMALADSFDVTFGKVEGQNQWPNIQAYASTDQKSNVEFGGSKWSVTHFANNNNAWQYMRCGAKKSKAADPDKVDNAFLNNVSAISYKVNKVSIDFKGFVTQKSGNNNGVINSATVTVADDAAFTENAVTYEYTGDKNTVTSPWSITITNPQANKFYKVNLNVTNKTTSNGVVEVNKFTFDYEAEAGFVQAPTMTPAAGWVMNGTKVELAAQDGASIFYTTDGTAPTVASTAYTEPITVDKDMTIKAIAQLNNNLSEVKENAYKVYAVNSAEAPLTPTQALALIDAEFDQNIQVYVGGTISKIDNVDVTKYFNATYTIKGEDGGEIIVFRGKYLDDSNFTSEDQIGIGDKVVVYGKLINFNGTKEINQYNYIVSIEKAPKAVETPVFSKEAGVLNVGDVVTISCATEGAKIYYTLDNTDPTTSSTEYTEAGITFNEEGEFILKAIAAKGSDISTVATVEYLVEDPNAKTRTATIIFANQGWEAGAGKLYTKENTIEWTAKNGMKFTTTATSAGSTYPAYFDNKDPKGLRLYGSTSNKNTITVEAPKNYVLVSVSTDQDAKFNGSETATTANELFTNFGDNKTKFTFAPAEEATVAYSQMIIVLESVPTSVESIESEEAAPARYFNLQGVEVTNPANGLYIRVQGKKATKVIL